MLLKYLPLFLLVSLCLAQNKKVDKSKKCSLKKLDQKSIPIMGAFGDKKVSWPKNIQQNEKYCKAVSRGAKFMKTFNKNCLNGSSKALLSIFLNNIEKVNKNFCGSKAKSKQNFISWAKCGNGAKSETTKCWNSFMDNLSSVKREKEAKSKIPLICCYFYNWKSCTLKAYKDVGESICPNNAISGYESVIDGQSLNTLRVICGDYNDKTDKCKDLLTNLPKTLQQRGYRRPKTLFLPTLQILDEL